MPGGDRTGPLGQGSMSGRGLGFCLGASAPGAWTSGPGRGRGQGYGRLGGLGFRCGRGGGWRWAVPSFLPFGSGRAPTITEKEALEQEAQSLKDRLSQIEQKLSAIEGKD